MSTYGNYEKLGVESATNMPISSNSDSSRANSSKSDPLPGALSGNPESNSSTSFGEEVVSHNDNCKVKGIDGKKYTGSETVIKKSDGTIVTKTTYKDSSGVEVSTEQSSKEENVASGSHNVKVTHTNSTTKYGGKLQTVVETEESDYHIKTKTTKYNPDGSCEMKSHSELKCKLCKMPEYAKSALHLGQQTVSVGSLRNGSSSGN